MNGVNGPLAILPLFNSITVKSGQWEAGFERLCATELQQESNLRPLAQQASAQPTELLGRL